MSDVQRDPDPSSRSAQLGELPPPDVVAFIRYCHRRRGSAWPELYDEMCGVAARREFNGWDHAALATRGLTFSLFEMVRLSAWVRAVIAREEEPISEVPVAAATRRLKTAVA